MLFLGKLEAGDVCPRTEIEGGVIGSQHGTLNNRRAPAGEC